MKKIVISTSLAILMASTLSANWFIGGKKIIGEFPIQDKSLLTTDHGGNLSAADAYKDGVGVYMVENISSYSKINNDAYNKLVLKYGTIAKQNNLSITEQVLSGNNPTPPTQTEINLANEILKNNQESRFPVDGGLCDDGNPNTVYDIYTNGICKGILKQAYQGKYGSGQSLSNGGYVWDTTYICNGRTYYAKFYGSSGYTFNPSMNKINWYTEYTCNNNNPASTPYPRNNTDFKSSNNSIRISVVEQVYNKYH